MPSYLEMRTRILDELANDGAITASQVNYAIQDTIKAYERKEWWFNSNIATFWTVPDQEYYSSTDFSDLPNAVSIVSMVITVNGLKAPLRGVDFNTIDDSQTGTVNGIPRYYAYFDQVLRFFPIPSAAFLMTVSYIYRLPALTADGDSNAWTTECEELVRQGAKKRIALNVLQADEIAQRCAVLEKEAYDGLRSENRLRNSQQLMRTDLPRYRYVFNINSGL